MSRHTYFLAGTVVATLWWVGLLGFIQDLMGPEAWTQYELSHWAPSWKSMPIQCVELATAIVVSRLVNRWASEEDQEKK